MKMKKNLLSGLLIMFILAIVAVPFVEASLSADANGDGTVNLGDTAIMAQQWLMTGSLPIEPNARIDVGFYVGDSTSTGFFTENHNLGRVPDFVMIFPCDNSTVQHPMILINNETDSCTEICQFDGTVSGSTTNRLTSTTFPTVNYVAPQIAYSTNRDGVMYYYIAVSKEVPAAQ